MAVSQFKKGDKVILLGFTGIRLAEVEIAKATKKELTVIKANGDEMIFDIKTGIQTNVAEGKEKYANKIVDPEDAPAPKAKKAAPKKAAPKKEAPKKEEPVEEEDEDEEDEEEEEAPKPKKKPAKKAPKKKAKVEEVEDEDDDEDYEEL